MTKDLDNLLLQAAGWTGKSQSRPSNPRWNSGGSGSDDDAAPSYSRKKPPPQVLLKKRHQPEKGGRRGDGDEDDDDDDEDSDSAPSVGSDLYKDEEDKEELEKMSELDREMILAERSSRINDYKLKQMAKRMRQQVQPEQVSTSHIEGNSELTASAAVQLEDVQGDKEELEKMSELDRELILAERSSRIYAYNLKQLAKRLRQQVQPEQVSTYHIEGNSELKASAAVKLEDVQTDPTAPRQLLDNTVAASSQLGTTAQDVSADNLQISSPSNENDTTSSALSLGTLPDEVKAKLHTMLGLLNQDIGQLVQDAEPIRDIFKSIRGHLSRETAEKLLQAAYIESRQFQVLDAQSRLEDRARQEQIIKAREAHDSRAADLDGKIHMLNSFRADIVSNINRLKQRHADLMKELREVGEELVREEEKLNNLPNVIADMEKDKIINTQKAQALRRKERPILGTADADRRDIGEINQIRLNAINAIHSLGII